MEYLFEFRNRLNLKKVFITIAIIILIILLIFFAFKSKKGPDIKKVKSENEKSLFTSTDNSMSLEFSSKYELAPYKSTGDYILELRSSKNVAIFVSRKDLVERKSLYNLVSTDRTSYINGFSNQSNLSEMAELNINGFPSYTYSFNYVDTTDGNVSYYLQIFWIQTDKGYYIIDVEFPLDLLNENSNIINELAESFKVM